MNNAQYQWPPESGLCQPKIPWPGPSWAGYQRTDELLAVVLSIGSINQIEMHVGHQRPRSEDVMHAQHTLTN